MKQTVSLLLVFCAGLAVSSMVRGGPDDKGEAAADPMEGAVYVGAESCTECHKKEHKTWHKMKHQMAWVNLPKKYRNLESEDPDGQLCISCHTTGFGETDRKGFSTEKESPHLLGVQCESCHGPGSKHNKAAKKLKLRRKEKFPEGAPMFIIGSPNNCAKCHNPHISHEQYKDER